ncbi:hypothetical protein C0V97_04175 [Asaia sp. W19]|uniref:hypothetical protein n=1 Tax=Asaia TaxID=91914 RepID=UPI001000B5CF|nr:hypothetical protein C0V97_04175 [Asaia sp. W19]
MNRTTIATAVAEAKRFIERADGLIEKSDDKWLNDCPKERGATRRASMDLTRALADMRRSEG